MTDRLVLRDYNTPRLNGGGPATWVAGDVADLTEDDAAWVNRDAPGTLDDAAPEGAPETEDGLTDTEREADEQAASARDTTAKQTPRSRGRRKDSTD